MYAVLDVLCSVSLDPVHVIGLYPHLLPSDLRMALSQSHPTKPPTLSGVDLEEGTKHLITYLTQVLKLDFLNHLHGLIRQGAIVTVQN